MRHEQVIGITQLSMDRLMDKKRRSAACCNSAPGWPLVANLCSLAFQNLTCSLLLNNTLIRAIFLLDNNESVC